MSSLTFEMGRRMRPSKTFSFVFFAEEVEMLAAPTTAGSSASRREKAGTFGGGGSGGSSGGKNEFRRVGHLFGKSCLYHPYWT